MAEVYARAGGRKLEKLIALHETVQDELETRAFEIGNRAEIELIKHRAEGDATIEIEHGDVDFYVVLNDERGQEAALSIEFGRAGYVDQYSNEWGEMEGLFILTNASHIKKKGGQRVRRRKVRRNAKPGQGVSDG